jgi:hypothetical protein
MFQCVIFCAINYLLTLTYRYFGTVGKWALWIHPELLSWGVGYPICVPNQCGFVRCCHDSWWGRTRCYCCALEMLQMSRAGDFLTSCAVCTWSHVIPLWNPLSVSVTLPEALNIHSLRRPGFAVFCTVSSLAGRSALLVFIGTARKRHPLFSPHFHFCVLVRPTVPVLCVILYLYMDNIRFVSDEFRTIWFSGKLVWIWPQCIRTSPA